MVSQGYLPSKQVKIKSNFWYILKIRVKNIENYSFLEAFFIPSYKMPINPTTPNPVPISPSTFKITVQHKTKIIPSPNLNKIIFKISGKIGSIYIGEGGLGQILNSRTVNIKKEENNKNSISVSNADINIESGIMSPSTHQRYCFISFYHSVFKLDYDSKTVTFEPKYDNCLLCQTISLQSLTINDIGSTFHLFTNGENCAMSCKKF